MAAAETDPEMGAFLEDEAAAGRGAGRGPAGEARGISWCRRIPNDGKDLIVEIRAGAGGQEAALWAGELFEMYRRFAERHRWKTEVLASSPERPRRVQGGLARGPRQGRLRPAEARVGRAPRAARARHRVLGADPHLDRDGGRAARGRGGRGRDAPRGSQDRRLPLERPGRAVGQHHRLRGAHRAPAHRDQDRVSGGALAAAEPGEGDALPPRASPAEALRTRRRPRRRPRAVPSWARATVPRRSAPTTSPTAGSPTIASSTRRTSCRTCWRAARSSTGSSTVELGRARRAALGRGRGGALRPAR